jgi:hypothetical protein
MWVLTIRTIETHSGISNNSWLPARHITDRNTLCSLGKAEPEHVAPYKVQMRPTPHCWPHTSIVALGSKVVPGTMQRHE